MAGAFEDSQGDGAGDAGAAGHGGVHDAEDLGAEDEEAAAAVAKLAGAGDGDAMAGFGLHHHAELASIAKHMTPALVQRELDKIPADVPVWIYHVKPQFADEIGEQLSKIGGDRVTIMEQDKTYTL